MPGTRVCCTPVLPASDCKHVITNVQYAIDGSEIIVGTDTCNLVSRCVWVLKEAEILSPEERLED